MRIMMNYGQRWFGFKINLTSLEGLSWIIDILGSLPLLPTFFPETVWLGAMPKHIFSVGH